MEGPVPGSGTDRACVCVARFWTCDGFGFARGVGVGVEGPHMTGGAGRPVACIAGGQGEEGGLSLKLLRRGVGVVFRRQHVLCACCGSKAAPCLEGCLRQSGWLWPVCGAWVAEAGARCMQCVEGD